MSPFCTRSILTHSFCLSVARDMSNHLTVIRRCSNAPLAVRYGVRFVVSLGSSTTRLRELHRGPM